MTALSPDVLTELQVAELLGCQASTVQEKARERVLPGIKFGHSWVFPRAALLGTLNELARQNTGLPPGSVVVQSKDNVTALAVFDKMRGRQPPELPKL